MGERIDWRQIRESRMAEPGATEEYAAARRAFELGGPPTPASSIHSGTLGEGNPRLQGVGATP